MTKAVLFVHFAPKPSAQNKVSLTAAFDDYAASLNDSREDAV